MPKLDGYEVARRIRATEWGQGTLLVAVTGGVLMVSGGDDGARTQPVSAIGLLLCLLAGLSYAVYALVNKRLVTAAAPALVTFAVFTLAAAIAMPAAWAIAGAVTLALAEPVTAFVLAVLVVGERPGWLAAGGGLLVLAGLLVVVVAELRSAPRG